MVGLIPFAFPGIAGVGCAFQRRLSPAPYADTVSLSGCPDTLTRDRAAGNRRQLIHQCGLNGFAELRQVHGDVTVFDPDPVDPDRDPGREGDGLATERPGLGLLIKTADCQPVLLAHGSGRYVAALHVGWRGNRLEYPVSGLRAFCDHYGLDARDVHAVRGPSLGPAAARFTAFDSEWGERYRPWYNALTQTMNLWRLTRDQLIQGGIAPEHIYGLDLCTFSLPETFFSYRRVRNCGRQASLIWIGPKSGQTGT